MLTAVPPEDRWFAQASLYQVSTSVAVWVVFISRLPDSDSLRICQNQGNNRRAPSGCGGPRCPRTRLTIACLIPGAQPTGCTPTPGGCCEFSLNAQHPPGVGVHPVG